MQPKQSVLTVLSTCFLFACAQGTTLRDEGSASAAFTNDFDSVTLDIGGGDDKSVKYAEFEAETLYALMVAEFALYREMPALSLNAYQQQARHTRDPGVIQRAIEISLYMEAHDVSLEMVRLWQEVEPDNPDVYRSMARQFILRGQLLAALKPIERVLMLNAEFDFDFFSQALLGVPKKEYAQIETELSHLTDAFPDSSQLWMVLSRLYALQNQQQKALDASARATRLDRRNVRPVILHAEQRFNFSEDVQKRDALRYMEKSLNRFPDSKQLHLFYANSLFAVLQNDKAEKQTNKMLQRFSDDGELHFGTALLLMEYQRYALARKLFTENIENDYRLDESNFYLSRIAEAHQDNDLAIYHLGQINPGPGFAGARIQIAYLLESTGQLEQALASLDKAKQMQPQDTATFLHVQANLLTDAEYFERALKAFNAALSIQPDSTKLLYSRAMLAERMDKLDMLEHDLLKILSKDANNAAALNALGYTLTDKTDRHQEAFGYISKAHQLEPNDPAIIDSMGWVHYRLGNYQEALKYLRQANSLQFDAEIAAHLGEVLWVVGNKEEAKQVWQEALQRKPESPVLKEVMQRFLGR